MFWKITKETSIPDCRSVATTVEKSFLPKKDMRTIRMFPASSKLTVWAKNLSARLAINLINLSKRCGTMNESCIRENATIARNATRSIITVRYWRIIFSQYIKGFRISVKFALRRLLKKVDLKFIWRNYIETLYLTKKVKSQIMLCENKRSFKIQSHLFLFSFRHQNYLFHWINLGIGHFVEKSTWTEVDLGFCR